VRRNTGGAATVAFATLNATARAVVDGSIGNYYAASGLLTFGSGELSRQIQIQLVDDLVYRGNKTFRVRLSNPSDGWGLGYPSEAAVVILENDRFETTNFYTDVVFPAPAPTGRGSLRVTLEPPDAKGGWRFPWESAWRASGSTAIGLVPGNYPVDYLPRL